MKYAFWENKQKPLLHQLIERGRENEKIKCIGKDTCPVRSHIKCKPKHKSRSFHKSSADRLTDQAFLFLTSTETKEQNFQN